MESEVVSEVGREPLEFDEAALDETEAKFWVLHNFGSSWLMSPESRTSTRFAKIVAESARFT